MFSAVDPMKSVIRSLLATATCVALLASAPAQGAEFRFKDNEIGSSNLEMRGPIEVGDFQKLQDLVRRNPTQAYLSFALELESPGGDVLDAIKIAEFARDMFWTVIVKGPCASACFFVYAAAPMRMVDGEGGVGVHRPSYDPELFAHLAPEQARKRTSQLHETVRGFLARNEVPGWVGELMFSRAPGETSWLTDSQIQALGARALYAEELITARCGRGRSDLGPEDQREFTECVADIGGSARLPIVYRLTKGTAQWGVFKAEMKKVTERRRQ